MNMPSERLICHRKTERCNRNNQMRWRRRDVVTAANCSEATFNLRGEDEEELIEGVERFK